jgi:uncharacterized protein
MAFEITIRFYEELNDFLPAARKKKGFIHQLTGNPGIKDIIESLGVPHTEVDLVLANGESVSFDYKASEGDLISVYPVFESLDISGITRLRPESLRESRFVADVHLGKLARYLRMLGFDTIYRNDLEDNEIIDMSVKEKRIILTRDIPILKNGRVTHGYFIRSVYPKEQLREVVRHFDLKNDIKAFDRCMECNGKVQKVQKQEVMELLQPGTRKFFNEFYRCTVCEKVYWKGSHFEKMLKIISELQAND